MKTLRINSECWAFFKQLTSQLILLSRNQETHSYTHFIQPKSLHRPHTKPVVHQTSPSATYSSLPNFIRFQFCFLSGSCNTWMWVWTQLKFFSLEFRIGDRNLIPCLFRLVPSAVQPQHSSFRPVVAISSFCTHAIPLGRTILWTEGNCGGKTWQLAVRRNSATISPEVTEIPFPNFMTCKWGRKKEGFSG